MTDQVVFAPLDDLDDPRDLYGPIAEWVLPPPQRDLGLAADRVLVARSPERREFALPAFVDEDRWLVRLNAAEPGEWRWRAASGRARGTLRTGPEGALGAWPTGPLRLSEDGRYLVGPDGAPFFWLADTAWAIVWKGMPEHWERYLDHRAAQGFSVIQVNLLPWRWHLPDVAGNRPFVGGDPARPNPAYFRRYDRFLAMAAERGIYVCLMLVWGGPRPQLPAAHFTADQAVAFARYAVARFASFPVVWSLSGDGEYADELDKWNAVGAAVEAADPYAHPTTNHLPPSMNWHFLFHEEPWHDFHMLQTGHRRGALPHVAALPSAYYHLRPPKAVVNGEPWYEAHPSRDVPNEYGHVFTAGEVRYAFWVSVLSGATMGHTYGSQGIWNWKRRGDSEEELAGPQVGPTWTEALHEHRGAEQCALGAALLRTLPWWRLQPQPERTHLEPAPRDYDRRPFCASAPGEAWVVYLPGREGGRLVLTGLEPIFWGARWFDPRTGDELDLGPVTPDANRSWRAPAPPSHDDWVLVLSAR